MTSILSNNEAKQLIDEHCVFYGKAEKFYKRATTVHNKLEAALLNEFRYCARAQKDVLSLLFGNPNTSEKDILIIIEPATRALKCVINDSIDGLVSFTKTLTDALSKMYPNADLADIYGLHKYIDVWKSIQYFEEQISESRNLLSERVKIYEELLESNEMLTLLEFLAAKEIIESKMSQISREADRRISEAEDARRISENSLALSKNQLDQALQANSISVRNFRIAIVACFISILVAAFPDEIKSAGTKIKCSVTECDKNSN